MGNKNFNFLYNKRRNTLKVKFHEQPVNPQTKEFNIKVTINGTNFPTVPASVTPDTNGNCNLSLNIANQELGIWEVEAVPVRNGLEVRDDTIYGEYNTVNLFARRNAIIAYVILALLAICFGAYKWMSRDTSVKRIAKIVIPDNSTNQAREVGNPQPHAGVNPGVEDMEETRPTNQRFFTRNGNRYVVERVTIPAQSYFVRIKLKDNGTGGAQGVTEFSTTPNPQPQAQPQPTRTFKLQPSVPRFTPPPTSEIKVHTEEVEGVSLAPGASYTQALSAGRAFEPKPFGPGIQVSHTGGQRIDALGTLSAETVTMTNTGERPVDIKFVWYDIIDSLPPDK